MLKSFKIATSKLGTQTVDDMSRLTNAKDFVGSYVNEVDRDYNLLGRLTSETQIIGLISRTVGKQYNLAGRVSKLTYPTSREIDYTFDDNHLPHTTTTDSTVVATYQFNAVNAPVTKTLGNNVSLNIEYNNRYQIKKHDWKLNGNTITGFDYGHDSVGNRLYSENLVTANKSEHFVFDNADRLTSFKTGTLNGAKDNIVAPTYSQSWDLDKIGNWEGFTDNGTSSTNTFSDTHEMTEFKGQAISYDNNGNLIFDGIRTFKYDAFNRIIEVKVSSVVLAEYNYDAFNRRVMKKVDADLNSSFETTVKFLYDGFRCIEELDASNALVKEYVYGSLYIDEVILQRTGATDYYFTHDYRYSVTSLTNLAGSIVESYDYKVYGQRTASGSGLTDIGYTGQRHDSETGLMYFKNRYYSTSMGSFVTRDPLGYVDGLSMYLGYFGGQHADALGLINPLGWETNMSASTFKLEDILLTREKENKIEIGFGKKYYEAVMKIKLYTNLEDWQECETSGFANKAKYRDRIDKTVSVARKNAFWINAEASKEILDFIKNREKDNVNLTSYKIGFLSFEDLKDSNGIRETTDTKAFNINIHYELTNRQAALVALHEAVEGGLGASGSAHAEATYIELKNARKAGVSTNFIRWRMLNLIKYFEGNAGGSLTGSTTYLQSKEVRAVMEKIMGFMKLNPAVPCEKPCSSDEQDRMKKLYDPKK